MDRTGAFDPATFDPSGDLMALMQDLEMAALVGEVDPPRAEAKKAIAQAKRAGIRVRMITGDHAVTAEAIAKELGFDGRRRRLLAFKRVLARRCDELCELVHRENGKPTDDAFIEVLLATEHLDWAARRAGGPGPWAARRPPGPGSGWPHWPAARRSGR